MAILAEGALLLLMVSSLSAQYSSRYLKADGLPPIILGHRKEYSDSSLENVPFRPFGHLRGYRKEEAPQFTEDVNPEKEDENNREYTVGAHFQVSTNYPNTSYKHAPREDKYKDVLAENYNKKPSAGKKSLFKPYVPETVNREQRIFLNNARDSIAYEPLKGIDQHPSEFKLDFQLQDVPNLYPLQKQFQKVASSGQIEKYLEDQQKLLDESLELQLLNDPNPAAKGKYHQFLKSKDDERVEREYEENLKNSPTIIIDENISAAAHSHPFLKKKSFKLQQKGLGHFRTPKVGEAYKFTINY